MVRRAGRSCRHGSSARFGPVLMLAFAGVLASRGDASCQPAASASPESSASACEALTQLALPEAQVLSARLVAAGKFFGPPSRSSEGEALGSFQNLPAFCRVEARATPSADSDIRIEIWLPASGWNGRFEGIGNGGFAGNIDTEGLGAELRRRFAAASTDTGHAASSLDARWALGHPEKVADYGHRGIHEMTRVARATIRAFYGKDPEHSYFGGCSDGGREALMEAQRYPNDYDGILAGAPANAWTSLLSTAVWDTLALTRSPASFIPPGKIPALAAAVLAACDAIDGVRDGILNDPRECRFDPETMACAAGKDTDACLTAPQAAALRTIYDGLLDARGRTLFPGYLPGAEDGPDGWTLWITGAEPEKSLMAIFGRGFFSNMVYQDAGWDYRTFTLESGMKAAVGKTGSALNAINPDLRAFRSRGGKLILYHGWNDPAIPARNTIDYYRQVAAKMGPRTVDSFVRLYMAPGVRHCGGGPGPASFAESLQASLERWVEKGGAPSAIVASRKGEGVPGSRETKMTRPLCPYPSSARYRGRGDTNDAVNFACVLPGKAKAPLPGDR